MIKFTHKHTYVYKFPLAAKDGGTVECEYTLCTNIDNANSKENRTLLEYMLRLRQFHDKK